MNQGLHIPSTTWEGGARRLGVTLAEIVAAAEAAGFDAGDLADHRRAEPLMGGPEASQVQAYICRARIASAPSEARPRRKSG